MVRIKPDTAAKLNDLLRSNVKDKYGDWKFENLVMCGKTGTAQVTVQRAIRVRRLLSAEDLPLAVVCIAENAGYGSGVALSVSNKVMQHFLRAMT